MGRPETAPIGRPSLYFPYIASLPTSHFLSPRTTSILAPYFDQNVAITKRLDQGRYPRHHTRRRSEMKYLATVLAVVSSSLATSFTTFIVEAPTVCTIAVATGRVNISAANLKPDDGLQPTGEAFLAPPDSIAVSSGPEPTVALLVPEHVADLRERDGSPSGTETLVTTMQTVTVPTDDPRLIVRGNSFITRDGVLCYLPCIVPPDHANSW